MQAGFRITAPYPPADPAEGFGWGSFTNHSRMSPTQPQSSRIRFAPFQADREEANLPPTFWTVLMPAPWRKLKKFTKKAGAAYSMGVMRFTVVDSMVDAPRLKIMNTSRA